MLSLHTSPLVQPGGGDAGGMNVYVRELVAALAHAGTDTTVYVRRWSDDLPTRMTVEPGFEVVHIDAGAIDLAKEDLPAIVDDFADGVRDHLAIEPADVLHANYWLSGVAAHRLKHELDLPLVSNVPHARSRQGRDGRSRATGPDRCRGRRRRVQRHHHRQFGRRDARAHHPLRGRRQPHRGRAPGVDHAFFSPGSRRGARQALGFGDEAGPVVRRSDPAAQGRRRRGAGARLAARSTGATGDRRRSSGTEGDAYVAEVDKLIADHG